MMLPSNFDPVEALTERELEILAGLADGLSNQEIANKLHIALKTVKWYNTQIYDKLGVSNRNEAIEQAQALQLLQDASKLGNGHHNLPERVAPVVGRAQELQTLGRLLTTQQNRLVTIVGPGGMGKTTLSIEIGRRLLSHFEDGVFLVRLAPLSHPDDIPGAIAHCLQFHQTGGTPEDLLQNIAQFLSNKSLMLIMDNFEHLLPDGINVLTHLLQYTPHTTLLVTSRDRLKVGSETVFTTSGLKIPAENQIDEALEYDGVKLFAQHIARVRPESRLTTEDLRHIVRICQLTEGMPLALVLAAAWADTLSLEEIAIEIQSNLKFLAVEVRDIPQRQWSIETIFDSTWKRLSSDEQASFMKFSVFRGGATRQAAQSVTGATPQILMRLINKSLIWRNPESGRYEIHELLRQYAEQKLIESGLDAQTTNVHAEYFITFMAQHLGDIKQGKVEAFLDDIKADWDNVIKALHAEWGWHPDEQTLISDAIQAIFLFHEDIYPSEVQNIITPLRSYLHKIGMGDSHPAWLRLEIGFLPYDETGYSRVKSILPQIEARGILADTGFCYFRLGVQLSDGLADRPNAHRMLQRALELYEELGDLYWIGHTLLMMCFVTPDYPETSLAYLVRSLESFQQLNNPIKIAQAYVELAFTYTFVLDDIQTGMQYGELGLEAALEVGIPLQIMRAWVYLAWAALSSADFEAAHMHATACIGQNEGFVHDVVRVHPYAQLSQVKSFYEEDYEEALRLAQRAQELRTHPSGNVYAVSMAIALLGLGHYTEASTYARIWFEQEVGTNSLLPMKLLALTMGRTGRYEQAAELMGFCDQFDVMKATFQQWTLANTIRDEVKAQLGEDTFNTAYQRGAQFDFATIIDEISDEF